MKPDCVDVVAPILANYKAAQEAGRILYVTFTTVSDYFWLLRAACECLAAFGTRALLYLAAAVSDFYVPSNEMVAGITILLFVNTIYFCSLLTKYNQVQEHPLFLYSWFLNY